MVFHVSLLKRGIRNPLQASLTVPLIGEERQLLAQPERILDRRMDHRENKITMQVLVKWSSLGEEKATWEDYRTFKG